MQSNYRWVILGVLFIARGVMGIQFQTVGAAAPLLIDTFHIDFALIGTLIGLYMLPGIVIALPGGMLGQRFGAKRVAVAGLLLMAAGGALMALSTTFPLLAAGRLISGVGAVVINVLMTKMVADWFAGGEIVTAMAILISSWPLGLALALILLTPLAATHGAGVVMESAALLSLACAVLVALTYRAPPQPAAAPAPAGGLRLDLTGREWLAVSATGLVWMTYNVGYIVLISFAPEFFVARGASPAAAGRIVSLLGWLLIVLVPLTGYLAERLRRPGLFLVGGFIASGLAAAALPFTAAPVAVFTVLAIVIGAPAGPIMALPAQSLRPQSRAAGMGVYFTWYYVGMAFLPGLAGLARDLSGTPAATPLFAAAMMGLALAALSLFRRVAG